MIEKQKILVVDDERFNINVLVELLRDNYKMIVAKNGEQALKAASLQNPDLILLDIMMPEMDGYEVCRRLKQNDALKEIPVLFISAMDETLDKVKGFELGAFDYITKPIDPEEVKSRVKTHLNLYYLKRHLEDLVDARTKELAEAHQRLKELGQAKNEFLHIISHEMRTPANGVLGLSDLILDMCPDSEDKKEIIDALKVSRERMLKLLDHTMILCNLEDERMFAADSSPEAISELCAKYGLNADISADTSGLKLKGSPEVYQILLDEIMMIAGNLAGTDFSGTASIAPNETVELRISLNSFLRPNPPLTKLFSTNADVHNAVDVDAFGLAPVVAKKIINLVGGDISASQISGDSGVILVELPLIHDDE